MTTEIYPTYISSREVVVVKLYLGSCRSCNHVISRGPELSRLFLLLGFKPYCFKIIISVMMIKVNIIFMKCLSLSKLHETW